MFVYMFQIYHLGVSKKKGFGDGVNIKVGMAHRKATTTTTAAVYKMC